MALSLKDTNEVKGTGEPGAPNQQSQNKTASISRANPVCLEVGVTIRSLPGDQGGLPQPLREEARTVIVFDNGAVLRSSNTLPAGLRVILTNPKGREVACKVAEGRNIPAVKGYVELEFTEAVSDFWQIHQGAAPTIAARPLPPALTPTEVPKQRQQSVAEPSRPAEPTKEDATPPNQSSDNAPSFEDIVGAVRMKPSAAKHESRRDPARSTAKTSTSSSGEATHVIAETSRTAFAPQRVANLEPSRNESAKRATSGLSLIPPAPQTQSSAPDFMSRGLLDSGPVQSHSEVRPRRTGLVLALVLLALAAAGAGVYYMRGGAIPVPDLKGLFGGGKASTTPVVATASPVPDQPSQSLVSEKDAFNPPTPQEKVRQIPSLDSAAEARPEAAASNVRIGQKQSQVQAAAAPKLADSSPSRHPAIPSLKMQSPTPTSRSRALPAAGEAPAPLTDVASPSAVNGAPPAALISATSRLSAPPAPAPTFPAVTTAPPSAVPAATTAPHKVATEPKLISSTRPVYPPAAREANVQGIVIVHASIDDKGNVVTVKAVSGPVFLRQAALESVKHWKYSPAMLDGKPASSEVVVNVEFRLVR